MALSNSCILYPVRFSDATPDLYVTTGATTEVLSFSFTTGRNYWMSGDDQADASTNGGVGDLVKMLEDLLNTHSDGGGGVYTCTLSESGTLSVSISTGTFNIQWSHASTTVDETIFGSDGTDTGAVASWSSPNKSQGVWYPGQPISTDTRLRQPVVGSIKRTLSGQVRTHQLSAPQRERELGWLWVPQAKALREYEAATDPFGSFEEAWLSSLSLGRRFRYYSAAETRTSTSYDLLRIRSLSDPLTRHDDVPTRWDCSISAVEA